MDIYTFGTIKKSSKNKMLILNQLFYAYMHQVAQKYLRQAVPMVKLLYGN
jgi:hypothetical protein